MPKMEGLEAVINALGKLGKTSAQKDDGSVVVGYTQEYAVYVHENLEANHPVGQAKFLEQPAREMTAAGVFKDIITKIAQKKLGLRTALLAAGLALQKASQKLVPVDTGALKGSAFTRFDDASPSK